MSLAITVENNIFVDSDRPKPKSACSCTNRQNGWPASRTSSVRNPSGQSPPHARPSVVLEIVLRGQISQELYKPGPKNTPWASNQNTTYRENITFVQNGKDANMFGAERPIDVSDTLKLTTISTKFRQQSVNIWRKYAESTPYREFGGEKTALEGIWCETTMCKKWECALFDVVRLSFANTVNKVKICR